jgi:PKD repeat protein
MLVAPSAHAAPSIVNTGFETNTSGWKAGAGTSLTRVTTPVHSGTGAARVQRISATGYATMFQSLAGVTPGSACRATAWIQGPSGYRATLKWIALNGTTQVGAITRAVTLNGSWQQIPAANLTAPTGTTSAKLQMFVANLPVGVSWYGDDVTGSCSAANRAPTAALTVTPTGGPAPLAVTADGAGSSDPDGGALSYRFDFGDGTVVGPQAGGTAGHTYAAAGTYTVTLTVKDSGGLTAAVTQTVTVEGSGGERAPTAVLDVTPGSGTAPLTVSADAGGSADPQQGALEYTFDFGGGVVVGPGPDAVATQTYTAAGTHTVTVTVTDPEGLSDSAAATVTVTSSDGNPAGTPQLAGAGDIATGPAGSALFINAMSTGDLIRSLQAKHPGLTVFTTGDNAYEIGSPTNFATAYDPTWGSFKSITKPIPGNHEYGTAGAAGYYGYFFGGNVQGNEYYAYDVGPYWRAYALNCQIACGAGSAQQQWLRADLSAHPGRHYLGYVHPPRYTSGSHSDYTGLSALWADLQAAGGEILLTGHNHHYERFAEMNATGGLDPTGMREIVVGSGGRKLYPFKATPHVGSEFRNATHYGVLTLTLHANSFEWQWLGSGRCQSGFGTAAIFSDCPEATGAVLDSGTEATDTILSATP